jgi:sulfide:quinone oxidoreductase
VKKSVLILGAGFGGLELSTQLSQTIPDLVRVTLLDRNDAFFFGFSKLEVMLGRQSAEEVSLPYRLIAKEGVEFRQKTVTAIDAPARRVTTNAGSYEADFVVVALGADYDLAATPGLESGGHEYYSLAGAERLRDALADFAGGRVLVSVLGQPFKCPPAPFEGSFLLHEYFTQRGIRESIKMSTTFPMQRPVPVTAAVSQMFRDALADRGVEELPQQLVTGIDPATRTAQLAGGGTLPYDLFIGIPVHRAPDVLTASGLTVNGWVPVNQDNLRTRFPGVYALGDVCTGPRTVPKAGIFAESAARVVAQDIAAALSGVEPPPPFEGSGVCYAEFGAGLVSRVEVNFLKGDRPEAQRYDPSSEYAVEKAQFGATRRARWFGS